MPQHNCQFSSLKNQHGGTRQSASFQIPGKRFINFKPYAIMLPYPEFAPPFASCQRWRISSLVSNSSSSFPRATTSTQPPPNPTIKVLYAYYSCVVGFGEVPKAEGVLYGKISLCHPEEPHPKVTNALAHCVRNSLPLNTSCGLIYAGSNSRVSIFAGNTLLETTSLIFVQSNKNPSSNWMAVSTWNKKIMTQTGLSF